MKNKPQTVSQQFHSNMVAIISLLVALTGLGYNTWREHVIEENRSVRIASFEVLKNLGELEIIVYYAHYQKDQQLGNPITGWGKVLMVKELSRVLPDPVARNAEALSATWAKEFAKIDGDEQSVERITQSIDATRHAVLKILGDLK
ncbi:MAG: hypothetical protein ACREUV_01980 [Burkholderiales bacterium]